MAANSEKREGYPDRKTAEAMLAEAEKIDPGSWGNHCRVAAYAAEKIALSCGMIETSIYTSAESIYPKARRSKYADCRKKRNTTITTG